MCFVLSWSSISLLLIVSAASGRPQKNTFVTSTLDLVKKLVSDCLALAKQTCSDDSTGRREGPQQEQAAGSQGVRGVWGLGACSQGNKVVHAHLKLFDEFILSARHNDARA